MIYGHGNDRYNHPHIIADFSSNVWFHGPPAGLISFLQQSITAIADYPQPDPVTIAERLAKLHRLTPDNILVTSGATEAFYLIAHLFSGGKSKIYIPSFAEYEDACRIFQHSVIFERIHLLSRACSENNQDLVWYANPNNPDGMETPVLQTEKMCKESPGTIFITDEAYTNLSFSARTALPLIGRYDNLVIVRSMTKPFSIPGIRLGYIAASQNIISKLKSLKMPWSVSTTAINAAEYLINNYDRLLPSKTDILKQSKELQSKINLISGYKTVQSNCNFFLVKQNRGKSSELKQYLIEQHNILIRDASNFRGLDDSYFRVSVQNNENNKKLTDALRLWNIR